MKDQTNQWMFNQFGSTHMVVPPVINGGAQPGFVVPSNVATRRVYGIKITNLDDEDFDVPIHIEFPDGSEYIDMWIAKAASNYAEINSPDSPIYELPAGTVVTSELPAGPKPNRWISIMYKDY